MQPYGVHLYAPVVGGLRRAGAARSRILHWARHRIARGDSPRERCIGVEAGRRHEHDVVAEPSSDHGLTGLAQAGVILQEREEL